MLLKEILKVYHREGKSAIRVQLTGISYCDGSYHICRNTSETTVIEYIVKGNGYVTRDGVDYLVGKDEVYLLVQGENQNYYSSSEEPWEKIFINVGGVLPPVLIEEYGLKGMWRFDGSGMKDLFLKVAEISSSQEQGEYQEACVAAIFVEMLARLSKKSQQILMSREMAKLKNYLERNADRIVSNDELATQIFRSPDYCVKLFSKEMGMTPYSYQLSNKIHIAKRLLRDTALSVGEIANRVGYTDNCYFSSLFKRKTSLTPREYRKQFADIPKKL